MGRTIRLLINIGFAVIAGFIAFRLVPPPLPELSRTELMTEIRAGRLNQIEIEDDDIILGESAKYGRFRSPFDPKRDAGLPEALRSLGVVILYSRSPPLGF
jgi:hypothetical protein